MLLLIVVCSSMGVWMLRSSSAEVASTLASLDQNVARHAKETPASPIVPAADTKPGEMVEFRGLVVDPEGKPLAGAKIYLDYFVWAEYRSGAPPRLRATSDAEGRFRFDVARSYFARPVVLEPWRWATVFAMAKGYAMGFSDSEKPDSEGELTIRMPRDDAPLAGRLVDLEGRPVEGADRTRHGHRRTTGRQPDAFYRGGA